METQSPLVSIVDEGCIPDTHCHLSDDTLTLYYYMGNQAVFVGSYPLEAQKENGR